MKKCNEAYEELDSDFTCSDAMAYVYCTVGKKKKSGRFFQVFLSSVLLLCFVIKLNFVSPMFDPETIMCLSFSSLLDYYVYVTLLKYRVLIITIVHELICYQVIFPSSGFLNIAGLCV